MDQQDLFGGETRPAYTPKPEHVRNHLQSILTQLAGTDVWPWDEVIVELKIERTVPYLLGLLDAAEAAEWRAKLDVEIARLSRAVAA
jgi:hypothetical protein